MTALSVRTGPSGSMARAFEQVWRRVYADDPDAVAPLRRQLAPILDPGDPYLMRGERQAFLVETAIGPVAHAVAWYDACSASVLGGRTGFFSRFESIDDPHVARSLIERVREWLAARGADSIVGPMAPAISETRGILVEGAGRPLYGMAYTPPYYERLFAHAALRPVQDLLELSFPVDPPYAQFARIAEMARARNPGLVVRPIDLRDLTAEIATMVETYNEAMRSNWGFLPLDPDELLHAVRALKRIYRPEYATFVELDGRCVAFQMMMPDLNEVMHRLRGRTLPFGWLRLGLGARRVKVFRGLFIAVLPEHRRSGIDALMMSQVLNEVAPQLGIRRMHIAWVLEDNYWWRRAIQRNAGAHLRSKRYRIFEGAC